LNFNFLQNVKKDTTGVGEKFFDFVIFQVTPVLAKVKTDLNVVSSVPAYVDKTHHSEWANF
jgi:hypothetical protein